MADTAARAGAVADNVPVEVKNVEPLQVEIAEDDGPRPTYTMSGDEEVLSPTTTAHENLVTAGEMRNARIMELSQAIIALSVTFAVIYTSIMDINNETLANSFFVIVGWYFASGLSRTINGFGKQTSRK